MEMEEQNNIKQKSQQLVNKFYFVLPNNGSFSGINNVNDRYKEAKQCALIAVDEMIETVNMCIPYQNEETYVEYWQEVKQEILNLKQ
jgi:hypothetical protein